MPDPDFAARYGPWALIAGASEGTGAAFARQLAARGLNLILVARRAAPLDALAAEIGVACDVAVVTAPIDLAASDAAEQLVTAAGDRDVGLLILNAGADDNGALFLDQDLAAWLTLTRRNVVTTLAACHHFGRAMRARGRGGMILVGSGACYLGLPGIAVYGATKAYQLVLGEALWAELKPRGVDVLNLVMGRTDTPAHRDLLARRGIPFPDDCASADAVAALGLERLGHGPSVDWGVADDEPGMGGQSAAERRERIVAFAEVSRAYAEGA